MNIISKFFVSSFLVLHVSSSAVGKQPVQVKPGLYISDIAKKMDPQKGDGIFFQVIINGGGYAGMTMTNCRSPAEGYIVTHTIKDNVYSEVPERLSRFIEAKAGDPVYAVIDFYCFNKSKFTK